MEPNKKGTALVTGGAIRVGKAICISLAKNGYDIALHYNSSEEEAKETAEEIGKIGKKCSLLRYDLNESAKLEELIEESANLNGDLSLLVNNASIFEKYSLMETNEEIFDNHMNINFKSPFFLTKYFAEKCKEGHVINILDTNITKNTPAYFIYLLTKKTLSEFTQMSARELGPNIRVNAICPGTLLTSEHWNEEQIKKKKDSLPLKKTASIKDVTGALLYLVNSDSITGQSIFVDSGEQLI